MKLAASQMLSYKFWAVVSGVLLVASLLYISDFEGFKRLDRVQQHEEPYSSKEYSNSYLSATGTVEDSFTTHLPLVVIDTGGTRPGSDSVWSPEKGYRVPAESDGYVSGTMTIIDKPAALNSLKDKPTTKMPIKIRLRGTSSLGFRKNQYLVKTNNAAGAEKDYDVMGMGAETEWVLNISQLDKSLIRNYMALNIAGQIMPYTSDVRYCEVVFYDKGKYLYRGLYLMMENVKRGPDRIDIDTYDEHDAVVGYLLRRDRFDETATLLDTYGRETSKTAGYLEVKYPRTHVTKRHLKQIETEVDELERALYSDNPTEFYEYKQYIDEAAFIDYFIINEFFGNYDAGYNSTYMYKLKGKRLSIGPVWDFDQSMDNYQYAPARINTTALQSAPWFSQLLRDEEFVDKLVARYQVLRQSVLSEKYVLSYIDSTTMFLGPAQVRDWARWGFEYRVPTLSDPASSTAVGSRNTVTHAAEIKRIKKYIVGHGRWLDTGIYSLYQFQEFDHADVPKTYLDKSDEFLFGSRSGGGIRGAFALLFIMVFVICIALIQRAP